MPVIDSTYEMDIEGFILTGGKSSRMGFRKDLIRLGGLSLVERSAAALAPVCLGEIRVVGHNPPSDVLLSFLPDEPWLINGTEAGGPLRGLRTALLAAARPWIAVLACDLPFVTSELFRYLRDHVASFPADTQAVIPIQPDGRPQPLCALFRTADCLAKIQKISSTSDLSLAHFIAELRVVSVPFADLAQLPDSELLFLNLNRPDDLAEAEARVAGKLSLGEAPAS